jgi:hypothetical protein
MMSPEGSFSLKDRESFEAWVYGEPVKAAVQ